MTSFGRVKPVPVNPMGSGGHGWDFPVRGQGYPAAFSQMMR